MTAFRAVVVGVADLDAALDLWVGCFELSVIAERSGSDEPLADIWDIPAADIRRQALVGMTGKDVGLLHLVEFADPLAPVREGSSAYDACPKNLDVYVDDLPAQMSRLQSLGLEFRSSDFWEMTLADGSVVREIHLPSHDRINVVLLELCGEALEFSTAGVAGIGPVVTVAGNGQLETQFYADIFGIDAVETVSLEGPDTELALGLPPGGGLDLTIFGREDERLGRVEVIDYRGVSGKNIYSRARPKALGILAVTYRVDSIGELGKRLDQNGVPCTRHGNIDSLVHSGETISFRSPAGFRIEASG